MKKYSSILLCLIVCLFWNIQPGRSIDDKVQPRKPEGRYWGEWIGSVGSDVKMTGWTGTTLPGDYQVYVQVEFWEDGDHKTEVEDYDASYAYNYIYRANPPGTQHFENWSYHYWWGEYCNGGWSHEDAYL